MSNGVLPAIARPLANSFSPQFIEIPLRFLSQIVHGPLHPPSPFLDVAVTRHDDRFSVQEDRAGERKRDDHPIPRLQQLFFFAAKAIGMMGSPVARAAQTTPSLAMRGGPFGPSGVKTMFRPSRATRIISRSAALPPRVRDPRADSTPYQSNTRAIVSPSRDLEMITLIGRR